MLKVLKGPGSNGITFGLCHVACLAELGASDLALDSKQLMTLRPSLDCMGLDTARADRQFEHADRFQ
jgi:hypothetical protein